MKKIILHLFLAFPLLLSAQIGGRSVYSFLNLVPQARLASLGGENITVYDHDSNFGWTNPALLNDSMDGNLGLSFVNHMAGINYGYASYAHSFDKIGVFHAGLQYVSYGKMIRADEYGNQNGTFSAGDMALVVGMGRTIGKFRAGANLKFINSHIAGANSFSAMVLDLGGLFVSEDQLLQVGMNFRNLGFQWSKYSKMGQREPLPFQALIGVSYKLAHMPLRLSITATNLQQPNLIYRDPNPEVEYDLTGEEIVPKKRIADNIFRHFVFGTEFILGKYVMLRGGYNHMRRSDLRLDNKAGLSGFSFGLGIKAYRFRLDYGYAQFHLMGGSHSISISTPIPDWKKSTKG